MMNEDNKAAEEKASWQRRIDEALARLKSDARKDVRHVMSHVAATEQHT